MKRITIKNVAKMACVSISTVSRYLSDPASIRPISAVAIEKAIKELNYYPNPFAQSLKSGFMKIIAVIMPDISDQFFSEACKALCTIFYQNKYFVMICDTDGDPEKERYYINEMIKLRAAGIVLVTCGQNGDFIKGVISGGHRIMLFDRIEPGVLADSVCEDNTRSGYELTKCLIERGHRRFAVLSGSEMSINMNSILMGVQKALNEAGYIIEDKYIFRNLRTKESVVKTFENLVVDEKSPRCIIACNSILLDGLVLAASRLHLDIPGCYEIAGFCIEDLRYKYPFPISAVIENPILLGLQAGDLMLKRLAGKYKSSVPKQILLNTKLILPD